METEYENGTKGVIRYCLKLKDTISVTLKILSCTQFKPKK